jgi:hypothetical protein
MAKHAANHMNYYILIDKNNIEDLGALRNWSNARIGFDGNDVWMKDLDFAQINSAEVKSIPYKKIYLAKDGKLYPDGSLLPERNVPSLLWTPVDRGLPVKLPSFNHNFFGVHKKAAMKLVASEKENTAVATLTALAALEKYIQSAPTVRLQKISWVMMGHEVLLIGTPLLPVPGETYWQRGELLIPTGCDFDLHALSGALNKKLNPEKNNWIICNRDQSFTLVTKDSLRSLSISSFRLTQEEIKNL